MKSVVPLPMLALTVVNVLAATVVIVGLTTAGARASPDPAPNPAPGPATTLRTQRLELLDESGRVRGQIQVEDSGEVVFRLRDEAGRIRVKLGASQRGSALILLDDRTEPGVRLSAGVSALTQRPDTHLTLSAAGGASRTIRPSD
jgi:hypothetical protein